MENEELKTPEAPIRGHWIYDKKLGKCIEVPKEKKNLFFAPAVHTDDINPTMSHATDEGKMFTSKARLREHYKENGYIETGGEHIKKTTPNYRRPSRDEIRETVEKAYYDIKYQRVPILEKEKQQCLEEQRNYEAYKKRMGG